MLLAGSADESAATVGRAHGGYLQFASFDFREMKLIEALRALRMLHHSAWVAHRWDDPAFRAFRGSRRHATGEGISAISSNRQAPLRIRRCCTSKG